jgi:uncharacterized protein
MRVRWSDIVCLMNDPVSELSKAAYVGNVAVVRSLLAAGAKPDGDEVTALMWSVDEIDGYYDADQAEVTRLLLDAGSDITRRDARLQTALHYASAAGANAVSLLLNAGADVNAADSDGETALHLAAEQGSVGTVFALLDRGADPNVRDNAGRRPVDLIPSPNGWVVDAQDSDDYSELVRRLS